MYGGAVIKVHRVYKENVQHAHTYTDRVWKTMALKWTPRELLRSWLVKVLRKWVNRTRAVAPRCYVRKNTDGRIDRVRDISRLLLITCLDCLQGGGEDDTT